MGKNLLKVGKTVAEMSLAVTKANVNTACGLILYQPKMPNGYEKLKRK